jgi:hypothetical protein
MEANAMIKVPADKLAAAVDKWLKPVVIRKVSQLQKVAEGNFLKP